MTDAIKTELRDIHDRINALTAMANAPSDTGLSQEERKSLAEAKSALSDVQALERKLQNEMAKLRASMPDVQKAQKVTMSAIVDGMVKMKDGIETRTDAKLAPVACFANQNLEEALAFAGFQSRATHASRHAEQCCKILADLLFRLINGEPLTQAVEKVRKSPINNEISLMMHRNIVEESEDDIQSGGYVINTLHTALWSTLTTDSFESAVLRACNLGDDADTTAAVAGQSCSRVP